MINRVNNHFECYAKIQSHKLLIQVWIYEAFILNVHISSDSENNAKKFINLNQINFFCGFHYRIKSCILMGY